MLLDVYGVRSRGVWFVRGQILGLCLCPMVFLHVEATIFNIYSTTMPFVSYHGQNIAATLNHDNVFAGLRLAVLALAARLPHLLGQEPAVGGYQSNSAHKSRPSVLKIAKFIYT